MRGWRLGWLAGLLGMACLCPASVQAGGLLQPSDYTAIASSLTESGGYRVNTSGATPTITLPDGTVLNGTLDPTGKIAVFTFGSINLSGYASMNVSGSRAIAILSEGNFTVSGGFSTSVSAINSPYYGAGSTPGPGGFQYGGPGQGGFSLASGGGGGYGGSGSAGGTGYPGTYWDPTSALISGGPGGSTFGLSSPGLIGGSAGGSGGAQFTTPGGGGGAIEFGAGGVLSMAGLSVQANGGNGQLSAGGGSGGEVAFLGSSVTLANSFVQAVGGTGGAPDFAGGYDGFQLGTGGNGGGGLVQIQSNNIILGSSGTFNSGGLGYSYGTLSIFDSSGGFKALYSVPEPSSLVMAGIATLAGVATTLVRRRSRAAS